MISMSVKLEEDKVVITSGCVSDPSDKHNNIELTISEAEALLEVLPRMIGQRGEKRG